MGAISGWTSWARQSAVAIKDNVGQRISPHIATATQYASAGRDRALRALQAWQWTAETATRENANAAAIQSVASNHPNNK